MLYTAYYRYSSAGIRLVRTHASRPTHVTGTAKSCSLVIPTRTCPWCLLVQHCSALCYTPAFQIHPSGRAFPSTGGNRVQIPGAPCPPLESHPGTGTSTQQRMSSPSRPLVPTPALTGVGSQGCFSHFTIDCSRMGSSVHRRCPPRRWHRTER